jgi:hypothetical protein
LKAITGTFWSQGDKPDYTHPAKLYLFESQLMNPPTKAAVLLKRERGIAENQSGNKTLLISQQYEQRQ